MKKLLNLLDTQKKEFKTEQIIIVTKSLRILIEQDIDYFPYVLDKLFYLVKFHKKSFNEQSIKDVIIIIFAFFNIDGKDFIIKDKNELKHFNDEDNIKNENNDYKQNDNLAENKLDLVNMSKTNEQSYDYLKFLFYKNFDSYCNLKYIIKGVLLDNEIDLRLNNIRKEQFAQALDSITLM